MTFQLQKNRTMQGSDICMVGQELGHTWNVVCQAIREEQFYGDGESVHVEREDVAEWNDGLVKTIFAHIFATHQDVDEITVMN